MKDKEKNKLFKFNEKKKEDKEAAKKSAEETPNVGAVKLNDDFPYVVELYDVWGTTSKRAKRFAAKRWVDGTNEYLRNDKVGFKEPFPQDTLEYRDYKLKQIQTLIKKTNAQLEKSIQDKSSSKEKDVRETLRIYQGWERSLQLAGRGAYMVFDSDEAGGKPLFMFDRRGNFKLPVFKNIDIALMHIPNEVNIAEASDLLKENEIKNGPDDQGLKLINIVVTILIIIAFCALMYFTYKAGQIPGDFVSMFEEVTKDLSRASANMNIAAESLTNVTGGLEFTETPTKSVPVENLN